MICSGRVKKEDLRPEQKWDFISLNDFKSTSCFQFLAYGYLLASLLVSVAVYGVDTFTAVNLLAFNRWSSEIQPAIPLNISKWIFSMCIIASWINLGYEYVRAYRVMKRGAVAESYLDSLAVRVQCIRLGRNGRGWRRFLVFTELTKSKKGAEYVALFTYFSFQSWIRVIFCSGPRQVVNALTLWSVVQAKLASDASNVGSAIVQFFNNIALLAAEDEQQAVILSGMLFTLIIWVFAALSLLIAFLCYVLFLWHYIPSRDGGLTGYCERKINNRLTQIVSVKVNKALEKEERKRIKAEQRAVKNGDKPAALGRQATLPVLFNAKDDSLPQMPMLHRNDTMSTLPIYESRPTTPLSQQPTLPGVELSNLEKRPMPSRYGTAASNMSNSSYNSNAPLIGNASAMGYGRSESPTPSLPPLDNRYAPPQKTWTGGTNDSIQSRGPQPNRFPNNNGSMGPPPRSFTQSSLNSSNTAPFAELPASQALSEMPANQRPYPGANFGPFRAVTENTRRSTPGMGSAGRQTPLVEMPANNGRSSPAPSSFGRTASPAPGQRAEYNAAPGPRPAAPGSGYLAFNPAMRNTSAPSPAPSSYSQAPRRNMTGPVPARGAAMTGDFAGAESSSSSSYRVGTPQTARGPYNAYSNDDAESQRDYPDRGYTESPASYASGPLGPTTRGPPHGAFQGY